MNRQEIPIIGQFFTKRSTLVELSKDNLLYIEKQRISNIVDKSLIKIDYFNDGYMLEKLI